MAHAPELRAGDADRQSAADRLRAAHDEGRLDLAEYDRRLAEAYAAVTYGDLDRLFTDLPARSSSPVPAYSMASAAAAAAGVARAAGASVVRRPAGFPLALTILWTIWASVVAINVTVWLLVSFAADDPVHFWPMWLAVPGVALGIGTAITMRVRGTSD
ncbi:DUF1707 SHOCT-like domain-containing protein [Blastococcus goldschmidtiae]|uniref:DUF1707 domain-containing protein n=1 Tax=Blastococcus goldschmidtiae TaxID=3075546 RepID=A0ABU2KCV6_9ACTN|nr:DUF1707 domain-containing protein [Blastococcus sp. DSM 46792]MDT0278025.1 DUF1707 domain-containing protein [Blastococcus sp. DSM 46792]